MSIRIRKKWISSRCKESSDGHANVHIKSNERPEYIPVDIGTFTHLPVRDFVTKTMQQLEEKPDSNVSLVSRCEELTAIVFEITWNMSIAVIGLPLN